VKAGTADSKSPARITPNGAKVAEAKWGLERLPGADSTLKHEEGSSGPQKKKAAKPPSR
jgi:hypothetical protein